MILHNIIILWLATHGNTSRKYYLPIDIKILLIGDFILLCMHDTLIGYGSVLGVKWCKNARACSLVMAAAKKLDNCKTTVCQHHLGILCQSLTR